MSTVFTGWEDILKRHEPKKKVILIVSLFNPVYSSLEEANQQYSGELVFELCDAIDQFHQHRYDGAFMKLLDTDWDNDRFVIGLSCNENADPVKLFGSNISRTLYNKWNSLVKTQKRLFTVKVVDYPYTK